MATINFGNTLEIPRDLVTVAQTTDNDILDLGYQCRDAHPYFKFSKSGQTDVYTKIHPNNCTSATNVNVYKYLPTGSIYGDGKVEYLGTGNQNANSLTYNGNTYTCTRTNNVVPSSSIIDVRNYKINMFSKYKPIPYQQSNKLSEQQVNQLFVTGSVGYDFLASSGYSWLNSNDHTVGIKYNPPGIGDWYRLSDFNGYNHNAICPIKNIQPLFRTNGENKLKYTGQILLSIEEILEYPDADNVEYNIFDILKIQGTTAQNTQVGFVFFNKGNNSNAIILTGDNTVYNFINHNYNGEYVSLEDAPWEHEDKVTAYAALFTQNAANKKFVSGQWSSLKNTYGIILLALKNINVGYAEFTFKGPATPSYSMLYFNPQEDSVVSTVASNDIRIIKSVTTNYTINSIGILLNDRYDYEPEDTINFYIAVNYTIYGGNGTTTYSSNKIRKSKGLPISISSSTTSIYKTFTQDQLQDDNYEILIKVSATAYSQFHIPNQDGEYNYIAIRDFDLFEGYYNIRDDQFTVTRN